MAFGLGNPTGSITFNLRFPGQYYDVGTNQFYNHNRYYNPELGRYMEPDPIGLDGGLNPYAYAGSNPVMNVDPSGLDITTGFGGMLFETYNWATGNGFDWQNVKGAFKDGYNGQGSFNNQYANMAWAATNDLMNFGTFGGGTVIKNTVQLGVKQLDNVMQMTKYVTPEFKAFTHEFKYADRVRARAVEDPVSHNFPYSFDDVILSAKPLPQKNGYNIYQYPGSMTGKVITDPVTGIRTQTYKDGVFEIGLNKDGIIDHRFFRPRN